MVILLIAAGVLYLDFRNRQEWPVNNFQYFEPAYLPEGFAIVEKEIQYWIPGRYEKDRPDTKVLRLQFGSDKGWILERGNTAKDDNLCIFAVQECHIKMTLGGARYAHSLTYETYSRSLEGASQPNPTGEGVSFVKDGTRITVDDIKVEDNKPLSDNEWGRIIDSFEAVELNDLKVQHRKSVTGP